MKNFVAAADDHGPNDDNEYRSEEWQPEAIYATGNLKDNTDSHTGHKFVTLPRCTEEYDISYSGKTVTYQAPELGHTQLARGNFTEILAQREVEIEQVLTGNHAHSGVHTGVVFHPREYRDNMPITDRDLYTSD